MPKYGGKVCFHVISYADSDKGKMIIEEIRALNSCSVPADGQTLASDAGAYEQVRRGRLLHRGRRSAAP